MTGPFALRANHDEKELKELPFGSFEPADKPPFARTGAMSAIVQISGLGASGTRYEDQTAAKYQLTML